MRGLNELPSQAQIKTQQHQSTVRCVASSAMCEPRLFKCPHCAADYHLYKLEIVAPLETTIGCLICDQAMPSCEGRYIFKYFLVRAPRQPRTRARYIPAASFVNVESAAG